MMKKYQKPDLSAITIPERTAYACNIAAGIQSCPHVSNVTGFAICSAQNNLTYGGGNLGQCA